MKIEYDDYEAFLVAMPERLHTLDAEAAIIALSTYVPLIEEDAILIRNASLYSYLDAVRQILLKYGISENVCVPYPQYTRAQLELFYSSHICHSLRVEDLTN